MQMLACLDSLKSGAGASEFPLITSRHWSSLAVESLKKLYNKTYTTLKPMTSPLGGAYIVEF